MRQPRFEIIYELRRVLGPCEETEHLIDWVQDVWETYDLLTTLVGKERAYQIINAREAGPASLTRHDSASYDQTNEHMNLCLLN